MGQVNEMAEVEREVVRLRDLLDGMTEERDRLAREIVALRRDLEGARGEMPV